MRVTFNQLRDGITQINAAAEEFAQAQWQVSSGLRLRAPSDDPAAAQRSVLDQASIDALDAYKSVSGSASTRLTALDSTLGAIGDKIITALTALQSSIGSTVTQTVRDAAAITLKGTRDAIIGDINSSINGTRLFGGTKSDVDPYALVSGVWTYQGTSQPTTVAIGPNTKVSITADGQSILKGSGPTDLLSLLDSLTTAAQANDSATLLAGVDQLRNAFARATRAQSQVGYDEVSVADGRDQLASQRLSATARLSEDRDVNMAEALTRMSKAQTAYQAALGAVAATSKQSLMDYIR